jgi:hypothetical protein
VCGEQEGIFEGEVLPELVRDVYDGICFHAFALIDKVLGRCIVMFRFAQHDRYASSSK